MLELDHKVKTININGSIQDSKKNKQSHENVRKIKYKKNALELYCFRFLMNIAIQVQYMEFIT